MGGITNTQIYHEMTERFDRLEKKLDAINGRVRETEQASARDDERIKALEAGMAELKSEFNKIRWVDRIVAGLCSIAAAVVGVFVKNPN